MVAHPAGKTSPGDLMYIDAHLLQPTLSLSAILRHPTRFLFCWSCS